MRPAICSKLARIAIVATASIAFGLGIAAANDSAMNLNVDPPEPMNEQYVPIRMEAEHIEIWFGRDYSEVKVEFVFRNITNRKSYTHAGFPDEDLLYTYYSKTWLIDTYGGGQVYYDGPDSSMFTYADREDAAERGLVNDEGGVIFNFTAWTRPEGMGVDANRPLPYWIERIRRDKAVDEAAMARDEWDSAESPHDVVSICRMFDLFLNPDQAVVIGHQYTTPNGGIANGQETFSYTLSTGANWKDTIGETVIDIYLADGLTVDDVCWECPVEWVEYTHPVREQWEVIDDQHIRLVYEDYEPEGDTGYLLLCTYPAQGYIEYEAERRREKAEQAGELGANNEQG